MVNTMKHFLFFSILCSLVMFTNCSEEDAAAIADELENAEYTLTVEVSPTEGGTVSYQSGPFLVGTKVTLTASANTNYAFKEWTGAFNGTTNPMELIMNANNTVTAVFELLDTDGDGVTDDIDACQSTPQGETADETGCSPSQVDTDGDTVTDDKDDCPDTPEGSSVNESGCITIFLDENGVTVKATEDAVVGESYELDSVTYLVVDSTMLYDMVANEEDVTKVITTNVTTMLLLLSMQPEFNQDISSWDVSNVTDMTRMFSGTYGDDYSFNQDISNWDVSNVTNMYAMFAGTSLNPDISSWDVSSVTDMYGMFANTNSFNQDIGSWDVSNVTNMQSMFRDAISFNQDIGSWDVSNVTKMKTMFYRSESFNQDLSSWDVNNVTVCYYFSDYATAWTEPKPTFTSCLMTDVLIYLDENGVTIKATDYAVVGESYELDEVSYLVVDEATLKAMVAADEDVTKVVTTNVTDMKYMFSDASAFNQDIGSWDVSNVTNMKYMFYYASAFNQDIGSWDVSNVTDMAYMFRSTPFNQNLSAWNVDNVTDCNQFSYSTPDWTLPKPNFTNCTE